MTVCLYFCNLGRNGAVQEKIPNGTRKLVYEYVDLKKIIIKDI